MKATKIILKNKIKALLTLSAVLLSFVLIMASCKKKEEPPVPTAPLPDPSVSFYWKGTVVSGLVPGSSTLSGDYVQYGQNFSSGGSLSITYTTLPSVETTYDLATSSSIVSVSYYDANGDTWNAIGGTLTASIDRRNLTSRFSGVTFHNQTQAVTNVASDSCSITTRY